MWLVRRVGLLRFKWMQDAYSTSDDGTDRTVWQTALDEIRAGRKRTHWMWFVFPQERGLGSSYYSRVFALTPREARKYLLDPKLGIRLIVATKAVVGHYRFRQARPEDIFGPLDGTKFRSCMDLFAEATQTDELRQMFEEARDL